MSSSTPPTFDVGIFIPIYWVASTTGFDKTYADNHYLKFPVAQGTEYMTDLVVSGGTTLAATSASSLNVSGKTTTANIDLVNSSSTLDMKSGSITNLTNINGSAYPQAAGLNAVLATGSIATNKNILMYGTSSGLSTNYSQFDGDGTYCYSSSFTDTFTSKLTKDYLKLNTTTAESSIYYNNISITTNTATPTINLSALTTSDFTLTGGTTSIKNTLTTTSSTITDATYTSALTTSSLDMYLTANGPNSVSSSKLTNLLLYFYDSTSSAIYSSLTSSALLIKGSSLTVNKTTMSQTGLAIVGSSISITNTMISGSTILNNSTNKNTIAASGITQILNADATTNNSVLNNTSLTLTGSPATSTNTMNATSNAIADATYTGTLTSNALSLFTNAVSTTRNAITNAGMTITGSTTSITNTSTSLSNIITDATRTITSGIISSVATFKALASSGGNSTIITPTTIGLYTTDGTTTTNRTELTQTQLSIVGSATNTSATLTTTNGLVVLSSGLGARVNATSIYIVGSGSLGSEMNRDPSTTTSAFKANINADFTPNTTAGAQISLQNANTGTGLTGGNPIIYERTKTIAVGDIIGSHHYWAKDAGGTRREYARTTAVVKDNTTGSIDSSLDFQVATNSTLTSFLEINGADNQIDALKPLDMNNNSIVSSTGGITLDATSSSGTGVITLNTKAGTAGSGTGLVLSGNTLLSSTSGGSAGQHLCLTIGGVSYKIALLNP